MAWSFTSDRPIYLQIADSIRVSIVSGEFPSGYHMPSVRELAAQAGVNPNTIQRAMSELEKSGLVITQRTSGRTVTEDTGTISREKLKLAMAAADEYIAKMKKLGFDKYEAQNIIERMKRD